MKLSAWHAVFAAAGALALAGAASAAPGASPFDEAPAKPPAKAVPAKETPKPGEAAAPKPKPVREIRGKLTPPDRVLAAFLWERTSNTKVPVKVDPKTGEFVARDLKLGTWDFIVKTPWGRLEGIDMAPKLSDYDALIPEEYRTEDLGIERGGTLTEDDTKQIRRHIFEVKRHENKIRDLKIGGTSDKAVVLVELMLDKDFVNRVGDEITWRIEQWYYEKKYDAWLPFRTRVLYRERVSKAVWATWGWQFEPALGGFNVTEDQKGPIRVDYAIPEKPVAEKGLAGTKYPPVKDELPMGEDKEAP